VRDTQNIDERPEKKVTNTPEKKVDTFDDLRKSDNSGRIDTFDDIRKNSFDGSINTFDDLRSTGDDTERTRGSGQPNKDASESIYLNKLSQAGNEIKGNEFMKPERWKSLSISEKQAALEHSGKALGKVYDHPEPSITTQKMADPGLQGEYGDGYSYDSKRDKYEGNTEVSQSDHEGHGVVGSDYGIRMNEKGFDPEKQKRLFGDDPSDALETYAHEFRHSYQNEQANAFDKGFIVSDPGKAKEWSDNLKDYIMPPSSELAKTDPERFVKEYEAYRNQPVEKDAREFGKKLSFVVYHKSEGEKN
jgi:hypothetical protein